jgi:hypothetical protein
MGLPAPSFPCSKTVSGTNVDRKYRRPPERCLALDNLIPTASLYQLSEPTNPKPCVSLVHTFPEVSSLLGIAEGSPDIFIVVGANFSETGANGTTVTFSVDFNKHKPVVKTITAIPEAVLPDELTSLPHQPTPILISDSFKGLVWRVNTLSGQYDVGIQTPEMATVPGAGKIGINGLCIFQGSLYFVTSFLATIYRVKVTSAGSISPHAVVETVAVLDADFLDDFAFAADGTIYLATNRDN